MYNAVNSMQPEQTTELTRFRYRQTSSFQVPANSQSQLSTYHTASLANFIFSNSVGCLWPEWMTFSRSVSWFCQSKQGQYQLPSILLQSWRCFLWCMPPKKEPRLDGIFFCKNKLLWQVSIDVPHYVHFMTKCSQFVLGELLFDWNLDCNICNRWVGKSPSFHLFRDICPCRPCRMP